MTNIHDYYFLIVSIIALVVLVFLGEYNKLSKNFCGICGDLCDNDGSCECQPNKYEFPKKLSKDDSWNVGGVIYSYPNAPVGNVSTYLPLGTINTYENTNDEIINMKKQIDELKEEVRQLKERIESIEYFQEEEYYRQMGL